MSLSSCFGPKIPPYSPKHPGSQLNKNFVFLIDGMKLKENKIGNKGTATFYSLDSTEQRDTPQKTLSSLASPFFIAVIQSTSIAYLANLEALRSLFGRRLQT